MTTIENRRARFRYELFSKLDAGLVLRGAEVKSIRAGKASLQEAYCFFKRGELFIKNMYIAPYGPQGLLAEEPRKLRKLLLQRRELKKWRQRSQEKGLTIVPVRLFFNDRGYAKLQIALAKGKKQHDKRHSIRERENQRTLERMNKQSRR